MPLVRYEIRNEYSLANPELYRSAGKDDPGALLEGVAMAGLVGIIRQLGDLAEFAAEVFHDLHEEVMATAARGHGLMIRVQQLEAEFPSVEKALMSETNQIRFAYTTGVDWHASIRNDQNHLTQGDLPRFILNSYEECRGPPRLFLLDKFDVAGAGACLKRYTDPSFFKMEWASSELIKAEKSQREKKARKVKKKGRRRRNGETSDVTPMNSRVRYSSLDLDRPNYVPEVVMNTLNQKLKSKQVHESPFLNQASGRKFRQAPLNMSSSKEDEHVLENLSSTLDETLNSKHKNTSLQDQIMGSHYVQVPSNSSLFKEDTHNSFSQEWEEKPAVRNVKGFKLMDNLTTVSTPESNSPRATADMDAEKISENFIQVEQKDLSVNGESRPEVHAFKDENDDVASEVENYMDALTTMESEMETDSDGRAKHEFDSDLNSEHKETGLETRGQLHEKDGQYSDLADAEATAFYNSDSSDESLKLESSSRLLNDHPVNVVPNVESTAYTANHATSQCDSVNVDLHRRLDSVSMPVGGSKEEVFADFNHGMLKLLSSEGLENGQILVNERMQSGTGMPANEEMLNTDMPPPVAEDVISHAIIGIIETNDVKRKSLLEFENVASMDSFVNAATSAGVDNGEVAARVPTPQSSLFGPDVELPIIPYEEPATKDEAFKEIVVGAKSQMSSPELHLFLSGSNINESAAISELDAGIENAVMQDDDEDIEVPEPAMIEASDFQHAEMLTSFSSPKSVRQISVESNTFIGHGDYTTQSMPQDSVHSEFIEPSMDAKLMDNQGYTDTWIDGVIALKSEMDTQENEGHREHTCTESILDLQESDDLAGIESISDARLLDIPTNLDASYDYETEQMTQTSSIYTFPAKDPSIKPSLDFSGDNLIDSFQSSNVLKTNSKDDITMKEASTHSEQAVSAGATTVELPFPATVPDNAKKKGLSNELTEAKSDSFLATQASITNRVLPATFQHSSSPELDAGSFENINDMESHKEQIAGPPAEVFNAPSPVNLFVEKTNTDFLPGTELLNVIRPTKPAGAIPPAESPSNISNKEVIEGEPSSPPLQPAGAIPPAESPSSISNKEVIEGEPPSPPLEHIKISFQPSADSPLSMSSTSTDHVSESSFPEKFQHFKSKTDDLLSSFHLLPEPAIPLQQTDENQNIGIMGSLSLHRQRKAPENNSDEMFSKMMNTSDDSENGDLEEFRKCSPNFSHEFFNQPLEPTEGLAVFSGRTDVSDVDTGSPGDSSRTFMSSSLSPETRNSLLNLKGSSAEAGSSSSHSRSVDLGSSPRSPIFSGSYSPVSVEENHQESQYLSSSQSTALETGVLVATTSTLELVATTSTLEPSQGSDLHEMPPPPPLPPLEWRIMKPREKSSLLLLEGVEPAAPPALSPPSMAEDSMQDVASPHLVPPIEKGPIEAVEPPIPLSCPPLSSAESSMQEATTSRLVPAIQKGPIESVEPPIPPALPPLSRAESSMQDAATPRLVPVIRKGPIERKDSLIEAIASHDKSMLKKVPKEIRSISAKPLDEREVLLEQIRTRSFNLRRTSVVKNNIPRPQTNINVSAILEKANAIRQAFAGSDEDDEDDDDWSDT